MPRKEGVTYLATSMSETAQDEVKEFAESQGYKSASEYIRSLIEKDMQEKGKPIDFGLTGWGMGRSKKEESPPPADTPKPKRKKKTE